MDEDDATTREEEDETTRRADEATRGAFAALARINRAAIEETSPPRRRDPDLVRRAEETEEDYQTLEKILKDAGVKTYRSFLDINKYGSLKNIFRPPVCPRDHFAVVGEKFYAVSGGSQGYTDMLKQIDRKNMEIV